MKITISAVSGTGKSTISKKLSEEYNLERHSVGDFFRQKAQEYGMSVNEYDELSKTDPKYDKEVDEIAAEFGRTHENFVIDGRILWYFIPDSIKIKLECQDDERYRRVAKRDNQTFEEAMKKTIHRDDAHQERFLEYYGIENYAADEHFDLIVDTTDLTIDDVFNEIKEYLDEISL